jgi:hypothetical protein
MAHSLQPLDQIAKTRIDKLDLKKVAEEDAQRDEEAGHPITSPAGWSVFLVG